MVHVCEEVRGLGHREMDAEILCRTPKNLLPVGKGLVKEELDSDRGIAQASDSDRTAKFRVEKATSGALPVNIHCTVTALKLHECSYHYFS